MRRCRQAAGAITASRSKGRSGAGRGGGPGRTRADPGGPGRTRAERAGEPRHVAIDREREQVVRPEGQTSVPRAAPASTTWGRHASRPCSAEPTAAPAPPGARARQPSVRASQACAPARRARRSVHVHPRPRTEALNAARAQMHDPAGTRRTQVRADLEGTSSQGVRAFPHAPQPIRRAGQDKLPKGPHGRGDQRPARRALDRGATARQNPGHALPRLAPARRLTSPTGSHLHPHRRRAAAPPPPGRRRAAAGPPPGSWTRLSSSTPGAARSSAGPWPTTFAQNSCSMLWTWPWPSAGRATSSTTRIRHRTTPPWPSAADAARLASDHPWARWAMPTTTPWARASQPPSNASGSTAAGSRPRPSPAWPSSASSKPSTTPCGCTPPSDPVPPSATNTTCSPPLGPQPSHRSTKARQLQPIGAAAQPSPAHPGRSALPRAARGGLA